MLIPLSRGKITPELGEVQTAPPVGWTQHCFHGMGGGVLSVHCMAAPVSHVRGKGDAVPLPGHSAGAGHSHLGRAIRLSPGCQSGLFPLPVLPNEISSWIPVPYSYFSSWWFGVPSIYLTIHFLLQGSPTKLVCHQYQ